VLTAQYQNCEQFFKKLPSYHLLSAPQNFCGNVFREIGICLEDARSVRIDQMEVEMHFGGRKEGKGRGGWIGQNMNPAVHASTTTTQGGLTTDIIPVVINMMLGCHQPNS
jgi:hypothetical protein